MNHSPVVAFMKDTEGHYVYVNKRMEDMFHLSLDRMKGKTDYDWMAKEAADYVRKNDEFVVQIQHPVEVLETIPTPDGAAKHWLVIKFPYTDARGRKFVGGVAVDITRQKEDEEKLKRSEQHYRDLIESSQGFICTHDRAGNLLSINPAAAKSLGYAPEEVVGKNMREFMPAKYHGVYARQLEIGWRAGSDNGLMVMLTKDGQERIWQYHNIKLTETVEKPFTLGYAQDVTDMQEAQKQLKNLTLTDDLTGLYNRRGFLMLAERQLKIARARRNEKIMYLLYADIDGLKQINDTLGHEYGSLAIVKMGEILSANFRASDIIARLGGDEFVVLVVDADNDTQEIILNRLQKKIDDYNAAKNHSFDLALSVGIKQVDKVIKTLTIEQMLASADKAMYEQKRVRKKSE